MTAKKTNICFTTTDTETSVPGPDSKPQVVALDIDDTITRSPRFFACLSRALRDSGHTVLIVTHRMDRDSTEEDLRKWGITYDRLILWSLDEDLDMDRWKASVCRQLGVDVFFEDQVRSLKHVDPRVLCLVPFESVRGLLRDDDLNDDDEARD